MAAGEIPLIDLLHHLGIVLPDADAALGFYRDVVGLEVAKDEVIEEQGVRGVLLPLGENEIELLQPVREDTGVARFLENRGPTLHHLCLRTDDIEAELARLKGLGIELIDDTPRDGLAGKIAFLHPRSMHGVLVELAEVSDRDTPSSKGFDRISCRVADYEAAKTCWHKVAGIDEYSRYDLDSEGIILGQLSIGQVLLELMAPNSHDSPLAQIIANEGERANPTFSLEVDNLEVEISRYRRAGIELPDPKPGRALDSRYSTISEEQAFGVSIELIEYES
uniref:Lactoylglutathione lyase and related lyases n=1 Tax=uncultured Chloroflexi bacterium HF0200_09I09 TaxID=710736 RepID=E0XU87_9CHLR|nr:lactoylglutathione lyase and related lyases [uncultured Chloroflexi bacterium HF0200_09I09]